MNLTEKLPLIYLNARLKTKFTMHTPIDPNAVTDFERTTRDLQRFWLFSMFAAGKNSDWASKKVEQLLEGMLDSQIPFLYLYVMGDVWLWYKLRNIKSGQYKRLERAITESLALDLRRCTLDDLTAIFGVGPKTARFFLVHSRKGAEHAVLDTHVLRWMNSHGVIVPKTTPGRLTYLRLEKVCLELMAKHYPKDTVAEADLKIWKHQRHLKDLNAIDLL